jgi:hypothetical protein
MESEMHHLYDRATIAHALATELDPALYRLLQKRIERLDPALIDYTEYVVIEPGDTEQDIVNCIGFSPLVDPIGGTRFGDDRYEPPFDWAGLSNGWFELIVTFGSTFAYVLFIADAIGVPSDLRSLCRHYTTTG